jgi:hypothetical protein
VATKGTAIFLDASIIIARLVHSPEAKKKIEACLRQYDIKVTSSVVRQEFKRRLLKEAKYLLELLNRLNSYDEVFHHVLRLPDHIHKSLRRKRNISLQILSQLFPGRDDAERTERAKLYMHNLLTIGLDLFDARVDQVVKGAECACNRIPVREVKQMLRYEFGTDKCSETEGRCGVVNYLVSHSEDVAVIRTYLLNASDENKSTEIKNTQAFLDDIAEHPAIAVSKDPCLKVGDLMIALESVGIPAFYTLNEKESQFFCAALRQKMTVRPFNPAEEDTTFHFDDENRQRF